ncbi:MAG: hypothetical protein M3315_01155 [Actinomycetota bacterium]|nr:hypothetical protein [Actinomycetota bacterium]
MVYAVRLKATDSAMTRGASDGKLQNDVFAFESSAAMRATLDRIYKGGDGDNLIRVSRSFVEGEFGKDFQVASDGKVCREHDLDAYEEMLSEVAEGEACLTS